LGSSCGPWAKSGDLFDYNSASPDRFSGYVTAYKFNDASGWACGKCVKITNSKRGNFIHVTIVDTGGDVFDIKTQKWEELFPGIGLGKEAASWEEVNPCNCPGNPNCGNPRNPPPPPPNNPPPPASGGNIAWNYAGSWAWATGCDFAVNDIGGVQTDAASCGPRCESTAGCTHFAWTPPNNCWLKRGGISQNNAFRSNLGGIVCGLRLGGSGPSNPPPPPPRNPPPPPPPPPSNNGGSGGCPSGTRCTGLNPGQNPSVNWDAYCNMQQVGKTFCELGVPGCGCVPAHALSDDSNTFNINSDNSSISQNPFYAAIAVAVVVAVVALVILVVILVFMVKNNQERV